MMSTLGAIGVGLFGTLSFLFFFWRGLHKDYSSEAIFKSGFIILFGFLVGTFLGNIKAAWFWGGVGGALIALFSSIKIFKLKTYETIEAFSISFFVFSFLISKSFLPEIVGMATFYFLKERYKSFSWYKSGKLGLAGLSSLGFFFISRAILALLGSPMVALSYFGKAEVVISTAVAYLCFFAVYNLSKTK